MQLLRVSNFVVVGDAGGGSFGWWLVCGFGRDTAEYSTVMPVLVVILRASPWHRRHHRDTHAGMHGLLLLDLPFSRGAKCDARTVPHCTFIILQPILRQYRHDSFTPDAQMTQQHHSPHVDIGSCIIGRNLFILSSSDLLRAWSSTTEESLGGSNAKAKALRFSTL